MARLAGRASRPSVQAESSRAGHTLLPLRVYLADGRAVPAAPRHLRAAVTSLLFTVEAGPGWPGCNGVAHSGLAQHRLRPQSLVPAGATSPEASVFGTWTAPPMCPCGLCSTPRGRGWSFMPWEARGKHKAGAPRESGAGWGRSWPKVGGRGLRGGLGAWGVLYPRLPAGLSWWL